MTPENMTSPRYSKGIRIRIAAVIIRDEKILLAEHRKGDAVYYLLPGGGLDAGETMLEALARELWEETRLKIRPGRPLFMCESIAPDCSRHIIQIAFAAEIDDDAHPAPGEDPRVVGAHFFDADTIARLPMFPPVQNVLVSGLRDGFPETTANLGNYWKAR